MSINSKDNNEQLNVTNMNEFLDLGMVETEDLNHMDAQIETQVLYQTLKKMIASLMKFKTSKLDDPHYLEAINKMFITAKDLLKEYKSTAPQTQPLKDITSVTDDDRIKKIREKQLNSGKK